MQQRATVMVVIDGLWALPCGRAWVQPGALVDLQSTPAPASGYRLHRIVIEPQSAPWAGVELVGIQRIYPGGRGSLPIILPDFCKPIEVARGLDWTLPDSISLDEAGALVQLQLVNNGGAPTWISACCWGTL